MAIYLIDGNSYVYRAFYAIRGLTDTAGRPTNAIYGFTTMLFKIIRERKPEGLAVSFDTPHPTARHELFEDYKAHRPGAPDDLIAQLPIIKKVLEAMRIKVFECPGYEADDVLATLAEKAKAAGKEVFIVTGDKDMLQLVGGPVKVYDPMKDEEFDERHVQERFGLPPERVPEFMALVGDASDNIPGVKGVGEKTAKALFSEFTSLEELMAHPERIKKERLRKMITEGLKDIEMSLKLAVIDRNVPMDVDVLKLGLLEPDAMALGGIFRELGFTSLLKYLPETVMKGRAASLEAVFDEGRLREYVGTISGEFAVDTETTGLDPMRDTIVGFSMCAEEGRACYVPLAHDYPGVPAQMDKASALSAIRGAMEDESTAKIGHNLKFDILVFKAEGISTRGRLYDTMVASYLLNPLRATHGLEALGLEHLGRRKRAFKEVLGKRATFAEVDLEEATEYGGEDAAMAFELKGMLFERIKEEGLEELYFNIEMSLIYVLADMEETGVRVDVPRLEEMGKELQRELEALQKRVFFLAGGEFNINSPKQLQEVLFERLGLKPGKRKKTGFSTDMSVLEELAREHDLPGEILNYRSLSKLKNTYIDVLPRLINPRTGRLHTSFNQAVTATGRLSSSEPNLQNIPIRGEWGRRIREAFIADEGNVLISADYSQIELRVLGHLSGDEALLDAFTNGDDIHTRTAMEVFGVPAERVTPDMRRAAKGVNFGVIYGITSFGLSAALQVSRQKAEAFIAEYFRRHPGVDAYIKQAIGEARERGFVKTITGRKRQMPELTSSNANTRQLGERLAVNTPIQGSAADIIKIAMINLFRRLQGEGMGGRILLQVHDELLVEAPEGEAENVAAIVREEMQQAVSLKVPVVVEVGIGRNWAEAH